MLRWGRICRETMDQISVFQKRNKQQFVVAEIANGVTFADAGSAQ
jgi:predicted transcriptional regulator